MMIAFILLFGFVAILFLQSGRSARQQIVNANSAQSDVRIAVNYISSRVRLNDAIGRIDVTYIEHSGYGILVRNRVASEHFDSWIYFYNGKLLEVQVLPGEPPELGYGVLIAELYSFEINYDASRNSIILHIEYELGNEIRALSAVIGLRSDRTDGVIVL